MESPCRFISLRLFFPIKGLNMLTPQNVKEAASSLILSLYRSAIFFWWNLPLRRLHLTHFDVIDLTPMFNSVTQKPHILTWLIILPLPACETWSLHQLSIKFGILQSFSNCTGCKISCLIQLVHQYIGQA